MGNIPCLLLSCRLHVTKRSACELPEQLTFFSDPQHSALSVRAAEAIAPRESTLVLFLQPLSEAVILSVCEGSYSALYPNRLHLLGMSNHSDSTL